MADLTGCLIGLLASFGLPEIPTHSDTRERPADSPPAALEQQISSSLTADEAV